MTDDHQHEHDHEHGAHEHGDDHEHHDHDADYVAEVEHERARKDAWFRASPSSPLPHEARHDFTGLPYFPVDPSLRFEDLTLEPYAGDEPSAFQIPTSDGQLRPAHRAGTFDFEHDGTPRRLTAYVLDGGQDDALFVPFLDYLDMEAEFDVTYVLDFNLAYHPYCVYADTYSCPLTPAENRLPTRIEAGERPPEGETGH